MIETGVYNQVLGDNFVAYHGDSCLVLKNFSDNSIDLSIYSPPFVDLFVYSDSNRDLENCINADVFYKQYTYIVQELLRITKEGRLSCVHCMDIPAMLQRDGYIGLKDFPGDLIRLHIENGWNYYGRCFIQKNPQAQSIRIHSKALSFKQLHKDSAELRPALIDQILIFKKNGENKNPVNAVKNGDLDNEKWINWANGIWTDINETSTLQYYEARAEQDEKHICPLQLETIERCIKLYSNPGETILTPFMGIGSEIFQALKFGRKGIGIELKESYFNTAIKNIKSIENKIKEENKTMFDLVG